MAGTSSLTFSGLNILNDPIVVGVDLGEDGHLGRPVGEGAHRLAVAEDPHQDESVRIGLVPGKVACNSKVHLTRRQYYVRNKTRKVFFILSSTTVPG